MLTPQEIQEKKFEKAVFGGYDMGQIDLFLDQVLGDYTSLYKENATLKAKMRVLVDKIEEYRAVDEEMRKTLYTAQVTAREITEKAKAQADNLLSDARHEADQQIAAMQKEIAAEEKRFSEAKRNSTTYINKIKEAMRRNIELMDTILEAPTEDLNKKPAPPKGKPVPRDDFEVVLPDGVLDAVVAQPAAPAPTPEIAKNDRYVPDQMKESGSEPLIASNVESDELVSMYVTFDEPATGKIANVMAEIDAAVQASSAAPAPAQANEVAQAGYVGARVAPPTPVESDDPDGMITRFFEVELGNNNAEQAAKPAADEDESDTARIYGDTTFTPKPRFDFSDIRFGKDYSEEDD